MKLNDKQKLILVGVLRSRRELSGMDINGGDGLPRMQRGQHRLTIIRARDGAVPINLGDWLGCQPTVSQRVMFNREFDRLEVLGLLRRVNFLGGRRASHLRLTEMGEREAARLLAEDGAAVGETPAGPAGDANEPAGLSAPIDLDALDWTGLDIPAESPADQPA